MFRFVENKNGTISFPTFDNLLPATYHFDLFQSLQDTLMSKIAILICSSNEMTSFKKDIRNEIPDNCIFLSYRDDRSRENLNKIKEKSEEMISRLLPQCVREKVLNIVESITVEMERWINDHREVLFPAFNVQNYFHWKSEGIIDREKTVNILLNLEELSLFCRFQLACLYCKEKDSMHFWNKMSDNEKATFNSQSYDHYSILAYWQGQFNLQRRELRLNNAIARKRFFFNTFITNVSALRYLWYVFWTRSCLYYSELGEFLKSHLQRSYMYPDIICCILADSNSESKPFLQETALKTGDFGKSFLNWPYQSKFLDIKEFYLSPYLKPLFNYILREKIVLKCKDYDYLELMKAFWKCLPEVDQTLLKEEIYFQAILFALEQESTELLTKEWLEQMDIEMKSRFEAGERSRERFTESILNVQIIYHL